MSIAKPSVPASRGGAIAAHLEAIDEAQRPRDPDGVVRGARSVTLEGSEDRAALLLHGFNDTPQSMHHLARRINQAGYTVHVPRLPGHGGSLQELRQDRLADAWRKAVRSAHAALRASHGEVHLCGQSMGGALAVLEALETDNLPSLVLLAPYLGMTAGMRLRTRIASVLQLFRPYLRSDGGERSIHDPEARRHSLGPRVVTGQALSGLRTIACAAHRALPMLNAPVLYLQSREDNRISGKDAARYFGRIGSPEKRIRWLGGCGHVISDDYCREEVAKETTEWFGRFGKD